jgi:branched-chain amino acid transport system substrate-binding protein
MHGLMECRLLPWARRRADPESSWRWIAAFVLTLLLGAALPRGAWAQTEGVTGAEVVIGQSCQLSGPLAALSGEVRQGAKLYFDHVNSTGGVNGRKIRLVTLDDAYDPKKAADNTRELIDKHQVLALFQYAGTPPSLAAVPIAEEKHVPLIAPFTGSDALRVKFSRYVFNIKASYSDELTAMVRQLAAVGIDRVAVVYLNNAFGTGGLAAVEKSAGEHRVTLLAKVPLEVDGSKMAAAVEQAAKGQPQAIIVVSAGKPSIDFVDAYLKAGHHSTFYMLSVISNAQLVQVLQERARGIVITQVVPPPWNKSAGVARELQARAGEAGLQELTFSQMEGFISAKFLVEGLRRAGKGVNRESLIRALEDLRKHDLGGYLVELSPTKHSSGKFVDLMILGADGKFRR